MRPEMATKDQPSKRVDATVMPLISPQSPQSSLPVVKNINIFTGSRIGELGFRWISLFWPADLGLTKVLNGVFQVLVNLDEEEARCACAPDGYRCYTT